MDKIEQLYFDADFRNGNDYIIFKAGYESREKEITKLRELLKRSAEKFNIEATELEKALHDTLPGGTYDSLLRKNA